MLNAHLCRLKTAARLDDQPDEHHDGCQEDVMPGHLENVSDGPSEENIQSTVIRNQSTRSMARVKKLSKQDKSVKRKCFEQKCKNVKAARKKSEVVKTVGDVRDSSEPGEICQESAVVRKDKQPPETRNKGKTDEQNQVLCEYCSKHFKNQQEFFDHRKTVRSQHVCEMCPKVFPFKAHLIVHLQTMHPDHPHSIRKGSNLLGEDLEGLKTSEQVLSPEKRISCDLNEHTILRCDVCNVIMSNCSTLKTHMMLHTGENAYTCCVCSRQFNSIGHFTHHMSTHRRSANVYCKICNIGFDNRTDLSRHQLTHQYECHLCHLVFSNRTNRSFHYKTCHEDDILKCSQCDKLFSSQVELQLHEKYHQSRCKTQCTVCGQFVSRLTIHMLSHSTKSDNRQMYVCDKCPKQFRQKLCFQRHQRTHSEEKLFSCTICPKRFLQSGSLNRHLITHTREKPFVCPVCGKACTQLSNLKSHLQVHTDSNLHYCNVCWAAFTDWACLQTHLQDGHSVGTSKKCSTT